MPRKGGGKHGGGTTALGGRALPFSGKAKKEQLKAKRGARRAAGLRPEGEGTAGREATAAPDTERMLPPAPGVGGAGDHDLRTVFRKETGEEVARGRADATRPLVYVRGDGEFVASAAAGSAVEYAGGLEKCVTAASLTETPTCSTAAESGAPAAAPAEAAAAANSKRGPTAPTPVAPLLRCPRSLADVSLGRHPPMPVRPDWQAAGAATPEKLEELEGAAFKQWLEGVYAAHPVSELNHFEHNLEVWRQLWRCEERSDVLLLLADSRCPPLHFHATLYDCMTRVCGKPVVLCLTKADLVEAAQARAWKDFFQDRVPGMPVVHFASSPKFTKVRGLRISHSDPDGINSARRLLAALAMLTVPAAEGFVAAPQPEQEEQGKGGGQPRQLLNAGTAAERVSSGGASCETEGSCSLSGDRQRGGCVDGSTGGSSSGQRVSLRPYMAAALAAVVARETGAEGNKLARLADLSVYGDRRSEKATDAGDGGQGSGASNDGGSSDAGSSSSSSSGSSGGGDGGGGRIHEGYREEDEEVDHGKESAERALAQSGAVAAADRQRDYVVIGVLGNPNVGKSSLLNTLLGRKKVSTSATPGHTKYVQTHFLCPEVMLCDCPGVTFPQTGVPRPLQVVFGSYPIAQVREPFAVVRFVAERCYPPLHVAFKLQHIAARYSEDLEAAVQGGFPRGEVVWSPYSLAMALALREGFFVKGRGGRPDVFRAANRILRDALNGRGGAVVAFWPPEFESASAAAACSAAFANSDAAVCGYSAGAVSIAAAAAAEAAEAARESTPQAAPGESADVSPFARDESEAAATNGAIEGACLRWDAYATRREQRLEQRQRGRLVTKLERDHAGSDDASSETNHDDGSSAKLRVGCESGRYEDGSTRRNDGQSADGAEAVQQGTAREAFVRKPEASRRARTNAFAALADSKSDSELEEEESGTSLLI